MQFDSESKRMTESQRARIIIELTQKDINKEIPNTPITVNGMGGFSFAVSEERIAELQAKYEALNDTELMSLTLGARNDH